MWAGLVAPAAAAGRFPAPSVTCTRPGACQVSALPPLLADPEVQSHLRSGLTSTIVVTVLARRPRSAQAVAAVDVRFEPWEEVFLVRRPRPGNGPEELRLPNLYALQTWWAGLTLSLDVQLEAGTPAEVEVSVVPFSEAEAADARRWYAEALRRGDPPPTRGLGEALDAVTLTSIKRRGVVQFSWTVGVKAGE